MLKLLKLSLFLVLTLLVFFTTNKAANAQQQIYFFYGQGCPHCTNVEKYFQENDIYNQYPIDKREIYFNRENAQLYNNVVDNLNVPTDQRGVPALVIGNKFLVGDTPIIQNFESYAADLKGTKLNQNPTPKNPAENNVNDTLQTESAKQKVNTNSLNNITLLAVILASIVDAINPCAFAVLILLMTTILISGDKKTALKAGLSFSLSIFISYLLMGVGLYKAIQFAGVSQLFFNIVGWLAVILGILNLKDYFWYGKGVLMEVPLTWRPKLKKIISSITSPIGAFLIGFIVSLFLLPCTSGPYIVILGMLAEKTTYFQALFYLIIYNLVFVLPMVLITIGVYKGFNINKAESVRSKNLKTLHLIAGIILIAMGVLVLTGVV